MDQFQVLGPHLLKLQIFLLQPVMAWYHASSIHLQSALHLVLEWLTVIAQFVLQLLVGLLDLLSDVIHACLVLVKIVMMDDLFSIGSLVGAMLDHPLKYLLELTNAYVLITFCVTVLNKNIIIDLPELLGIAFECQSLVVWIPWMCPSEGGQHQF